MNCLNFRGLLVEWSRWRGGQSRPDINKERQKSSVNKEAKSAEQSSSSQPADKKRATDKRCHNCGSKPHLRSQCPKNEPKCFKCDKFCHISTQCPGVVKKEVNCVSQKDSKLVTMNISGYDFSVLIDTGADDSHIRIDTYEKLGRLQPSLKSNRIFEGFRGTTRLFGVTISINISHNGEVYRPKLFVVPIRAIKADFILGRDWMQNVIFTVDRGIIKMYIELRLC